MLQEWEYADDVDFADEECEPLDSLLQTACTHLREWNLLLNESKTEFTHIYLAEATEVGDQGALTQGNKAWHSSKSLGFLLCSSKDIMHRFVLGNLSFRSFWSMWMRGAKILCKSDFKCTMLCVCLPCCITVAAGLHCRPFKPNLIPATDILCAPSSASIGHTATSSMRHSTSDATPDHYLRQ